MNNTSSQDQKNKLFTIKTGLLTFVAVACSVGMVVVAMYPEKNVEQQVVASQHSDIEEQKESEEDKKAEAEAKMRLDDVQVKNAISAASASISEFVNNSNGKLPSTDGDMQVVNASLSGVERAHPVTGQQFVLTQTEPKDHELYFSGPRKGCNEDGTLLDVTSPRMSAVQGMLVSGTLHCVEN